MLRLVTITGADDAVHPEELAAISGEYPFVEWGILFSATRVGTPRYPNKAWISMTRDLGLRLSAHVCGRTARDLMQKGHLLIPPRFQRVQVNGFSTNRYAGPFIRTLRKYSATTEFILQVGDPKTLAAVPGVFSPCSVLWDPSGGRGIEQKEWPPPPEGLHMGYAGGIGPGNVVQTLETLERTAPASSYWIDMESGVRTDDALDLDKVREVLRATKPFLSEEGARS